MPDRDAARAIVSQLATRNPGVQRSPGNPLIGTAPFNPLHIREVCHWFDPTSIPLSGAVPAPFNAWKDMATAGYLTQNTGSLQPLVVPNGNNGSAIVRYDGVDDRLDSTNFSNAILAGKPFSMFAAAKVNSIPSAKNWSPICAGMNGSGYQYNWMYCQNGGLHPLFSYFDGASTKTHVDTANITLGAWTLFEIDYDVSNYQFYLNGVPGLSAAKLGDALYRADVHVGENFNASCVDGDQGDIILCSNKLSLSDRSDLRAWLAKRWNIQGVRLF